MENHRLQPAVDAFNRAAYRDALLLFEAHWAIERSALLQALILLCNALNQLHLGLVSGPVRNLATAARLLDECPDNAEGLDMLQCAAMSLPCAAYFRTPR